MENLKPNQANSSPLTPIGFLERSATVYGDCPSIVYNDSVYTWSETYQRCLRLASSIVVSLGIKRRQVVSVVAPNIPAMYELHFAVPMAGAVLNNLNTRLDARTISSMLRHGAESKLVFVDQHSVDLVLDAVSLFPEHTLVPRLVLIADELAPSPSPEIGVNSRFYSTYEDLVDRGDSEFQWLRPETEWDPIVLNYTSGTTSSPKGVVHCHRGIFIVTVDSLVEWSVPKQPVYLWTLPMFHGNGWSYTWGMAAVGGTNICLRKFDGPAIFNLIRRHGVTHMCGAPVVLNMLVEVESALYGHPAVDETAVVARPDDFWGESPCAFVKLKNGVTRKPTEEEIMEYCREKLPHYMVPKSVVFRDELPKTSTGKIQKFLLKDIAKKMGSAATTAAGVVVPSRM
ncbi:hypothetical protein TIFTF001_027495 [Ficus carica]|uniref:AMP-dependent synthetase/ligase domain-containing protein n=1 Tax=Ficus carica TaxID=3494 RepID=A0AA88IYM3_FICCA|nr:hypothetical protein TIFTF001_027495 [Ficus carica]